MFYLVEDEEEKEDIRGGGGEDSSDELFIEGNERREEDEEEEEWERSEGWVKKRVLEIERTLIKKREQIAQEKALKKYSTGSMPCVGGNISVRRRAESVDEGIAIYYKGERRKEEERGEEGERGERVERAEEGGSGGEKGIKECTNVEGEDMENTEEVNEISECTNVEMRKRGIYVDEENEMREVIEEEIASEEETDTDNTDEEETETEDSVEEDEEEDKKQKEESLFVEQVEIRQKRCSRPSSLYRYSSVRPRTIIMGLG